MLRSIVLPAYNESGYIAEMIRSTIAAASSKPEPFELVVVDNASTDDTPRIVEALAEQDSRIRLVRHAENRLYAGSCLSGTRAARGDRIFILDSDGQHPPSDIWKFDAQLASGADIVFGWRRRRREGPRRLLLSRVLLVLARLYVGYSLHDVNCGIRGFNRAYADRLEVRYLVNLVNPELFVRARLGHFSIGEVAVEQELRKAGVSSHDLGRLWEIFKAVHHYFWELRKELRAGRSL